MDCNPPGSSVHRILQARILKWVAKPPLEDLPDPGIESRSPALQADTLTSEPPGKVPEEEYKFERRGLGKKRMWSAVLRDEGEVRA